jgi:ABC-2 type transport system permease protein
MSTRAHTYALRDSATMLRRNLKHVLRYPSVSVLNVGLPVVLLLLFVYVFGGTMGAGLGAGASGRSVYVDFVTPGILLVALAGIAQGTAIGVSMDMAEGIIARFRTMGISRSAVLTGHLMGGTIQSLLGLAAVIAVAYAIGFRPSASAEEWLAASGVLVLITVAIAWFSVALGLKAKSVEAASNLAMPLMLLVFVGSGFVPTSSMPAGLRGFADYQPMTPIIDTLRGLLMGTPIGHDAMLAVGWCALIAFAGYRWAMRLYEGDPTRKVKVLSAGGA